ncbi:SDR family NAD(P)-dependent oxidoreductase [Sporolactobacillus terrae]|uniref:SDR family oxidoreductase n=1 Tax=Sporolactobacillus terrae TaxID=269673 RepID=A0ABX5Q7P7_9BACL|nr:SDR family oxidoreductase [Sporolactobacillus terrae]QAA22672.1 SDR family oxidoreductase [Sporolactobacillus terrae]QAA25645.1 SDR family oxidoreductase [Sporolactobacillus terrae]UAK17456.1 SDR family oxidoreductase [Sporolactobacillus terrae]
MKLTNKMVVITGASSGLGRELSILCAANGAHIIMLARSTAKLKTLKDKIEQSGGRAVYESLDITDAKQVHLTFQAIMEKFKRIDLLINCAGVGYFQPLTEMNTEEIDQMIAVNVRGLIYCTHEAAQAMEAQKCGSIVMIASQAGIITTPKSVVYGATKHAVIGFANGVRMELEEAGVHVTVVNPGPIRTPFMNNADPTGNYRKRVDRFMLDPRHTAERILHAVGKNKRTLNLPWYMGIGSKVYQCVPAVFEKVCGPFLRMK